MSEDFLEWARKQHENWLFNAITADAGIKSLLPKQGEKMDIPMLPEPAPKHDGFLDERHEYEVSYWQKESKTPKIYIEETDMVKDEPEFIGINPNQALSLLAWLKQEEAELQQLAEEQEQGGEQQ